LKGKNQKLNKKERKKYLKREKEEESGRGVNEFEAVNL
jgi:hypothetical protein